MGVALEPRQGEPARWLGDGAGLVEDVLYGGADLIGRHRHDFVEGGAADPERLCPHLADRDPVGEEAHAVERHARVGGERRRHAGRIVGLDADHLDVGPQELDEARHPGREASAAHRHEDRFQRTGMLLQDLHADRALPRDDVWVVVRVHEGQAVAAAEVERMPIGFVEGIALQHDRGAAGLHGRDLDAGRRAGHDDRGRHPELLGRQSDALRMVARRRADHATLQRFARQSRHLVVGAAELEREDRLQVFALQENVIAEPRRQPGHSVERADGRDVVDTGRQDLAGIAAEIERLRLLLDMDVHDRTMDEFWPLRAWSCA